MLRIDAILAFFPTEEGCSKYLVSYSAIKSSYKGISNALTRRCVQTFSDLSDLVSKFCTIENA